MNLHFGHVLAGVCPCSWIAWIRFCDEAHLMPNLDMVIKVMHFTATGVALETVFGGLLLQNQLSIEITWPDHRKCASSHNLIHAIQLHGRTLAKKCPKCKFNFLSCSWHLEAQIWKAFNTLIQLSKYENLTEYINYYKSYSSLSDDRFLCHPVHVYNCTWVNIP